MKGLKILMVSDAIYPDKAGGSYKLVYGLSKALVHAGHNLTVLAGSSNPELPHFEIREGVRIIRYHRSERNPAFSISTVVRNARRAALKLFRHNEFNIVNLHYTLSGFGVLLSSSARKCPVVVTFHSPDFLDFSLNMAQRTYIGVKSFLKPFYVKCYSYWLKRQQGQQLHKCDGIVCVSEYMKNLAARIFKIPDSEIQVIPHSVDTNRFFPAENAPLAKEKVGLTANNMVILTVRRLEYRMGIDNLIRAMVAIRRRIPQALLLIVGTGSQQENLRGLVSKLNLSQSVKFTGFVEDSRLPEYYRGADLFVLPTRELEGFGLVTLEALASGVPVIGTPVGATAEILRGLDAGLLASDARPASIASAVIKFYERSSQRDVMSLKCREYVLKKYTWDHVVKGYRAAFEDAILRRKARP